MRVLIVHDEPSMHDLYQQCFGVAEVGGDCETTDGVLADRITDHAVACANDDDHVVLEPVYADRGLAAIDHLASAPEQRFAVAIIDLGAGLDVDCHDTAARIRAFDPDVNIMLVTSGSAMPANPIDFVPGPFDKLFYLAKPFTAAQVTATAMALCRRWSNDRALATTRAALATATEALEQQKLLLAAQARAAAHIASHDPLTGAPNRVAFLQRLGDLTQAGQGFAIAMVDLDRFKLVNDTFGHLAGDELLRLVYATLEQHLPDGGMVARLAGDEFGLLFAAASEDAAMMVCDRLINACATHFVVFGHSVQSSVSMGLVVADATLIGDPIDLLRRADLALNEAKRRGRANAKRFDDSMDEAIRFRRRIESGLGAAIANNELRLVFQPIVEHANLEVVAFEALLRWDSPEHGMISPAMFIPIAEESDLIHDLGDWVLDEALAALQQWPGQYVSVNFSPRQFRRQNFVAHVVARVQHAGISPTRLQIEITETAIFDDAERAADTLYRLRQMGFRIALDDFGTGYSSLYNIRKFALDCLKIDKSFTDGIGRERESAAIVQSIIYLSRALGLEVVAEGVETAAQVQALRIAGCSHLQGYHLSRPVEADEAIEMAHERYLAADPREMQAGGDGMRGHLT